MVTGAAGAAVCGQADLAGRSSAAETSASTSARRYFGRELSASRTTVMSPFASSRRTSRSDRDRDAMTWGRVISTLDRWRAVTARPPERVVRCGRLPRSGGSLRLREGLARLEAEDADGAALAPRVPRVDEPGEALG